MFRQGRHGTSVPEDVSCKRRGSTALDGREATNATSSLNGRGRTVQPRSRCAQRTSICRPNGAHDSHCGASRQTMCRCLAVVCEFCAFTQGRRSLSRRLLHYSRPAHGAGHNLSPKCGAPSRGVVTKAAG